MPLNCLATVPAIPLCPVLVLAVATAACAACVLLLQAGKPFFGICLGLQLLFEGSDESGGHEGLGVIPGRVAHFDVSRGLPVPHIGWNTLEQLKSSELLAAVAPSDRVYFVHSFRCVYVCVCSAAVPATWCPL